MLCAWEQAARTSIQKTGSLAAGYRSGQYCSPIRSLTSMRTMLRMAWTLYIGTVPKDGWDMRDLLAAYCASRMDSNENLDFTAGQHAGSLQTSGY